MKRSKSLEIIHFINITLYINKELVTYHEDVKDALILFRILISSLSIVFAVPMLISGILPDEPYFLDDKTQKGLRKFAIINLFLELIADTSTVASLTSYTAIKETKFVRRVWNWIGSFVALLFLAFFVWFLFGISISDNKVYKTPIEIFNNAFSNSLYNKLALMIFIGTALLCFFSILWRIIADRQRKNDIYWRRQPIYMGLVSFGIIISLVLVTMYFNLTVFEMFVLVALVYVVGKLIENALDPPNGKDNKQRIFSETPYYDPSNDMDNNSLKELTFEEMKNEKKNNLQYFYNFGDENTNQELIDYNKFNNELKCFKNAQEIKDFTKTQPVVNVWLNDNINDVTMISSFYDLKKGLFTKKVKTDEFTVVIVKKDENNNRVECYWSTKNYEDLETIFYEFIVNKRTPILNYFLIL